MNLLVRIIESSNHRFLSFPFQFLKYRLRRYGATRPPVSIPQDDDFRQLSFTFAIIAIAAQLACIDGPLTPAKYAAFREAFPLKGKICSKIRSLFLLACDNPVPYTHYVTQIHYLFPGQPELCVSLVEQLFNIAIADGIVSPEAEEMLSHIAHMLELKPAEYANIHARHVHPQAHQVLGVPKRTSGSALKKRYRELMRRWHPDRFAGDEISPEMELLLKRKSSEISEAYQRLKKSA